MKEKRARHLQECGEKISQYDDEIRDLSASIEKVREVIAKIGKEISQSDASIANLRENIRVRRLIRDIKKTQMEIDAYDMEEAAKAKRTFSEKYQTEKDKEAALQGKVNVGFSLPISFS